MDTEKKKATGEEKKRRGRGPAAAGRVAALI
jgi:hypothetical protein